MVKVRTLEIRSIYIDIYIVYSIYIYIYMYIYMYVTWNYQTQHLYKC